LMRGPFFDALRVCKACWFRTQMLRQAAGGIGILLKGMAQNPNPPVALSVALWLGAGRGAKIFESIVFFLWQN